MMWRSVERGRVPPREIVLKAIVSENYFFYFWIMLTKIHMLMQRREIGKKEGNGGGGEITPGVPIPVPPPFTNHYS